MSICDKLFELRLPSLPKFDDPLRSQPATCCTIPCPNVPNYRVDKTRCKPFEHVTVLGSCCPIKSESLTLLSYDLPHFSNSRLAGDCRLDRRLHAQSAQACVGYSLGRDTGCGSRLFKKD